MVEPMRYKCPYCKKIITIKDPISESFYRYSNTRACGCSFWTYDFKTGKWYQRSKK